MSRATMGVLFRKALATITGTNMRTCGSGGSTFTAYFRIQSRPCRPQKVYRQSAVFVQMHVTPMLPQGLRTHLCPKGRPGAPEHIHQCLLHACQSEGLGIAGSSLS